jgi:hypothetical protein
MAVGLLLPTNDATLLTSNVEPLLPFILLKSMVCCQSRYNVDSTRSEFFDRSTVGDFSW